MLSDKSEQRAVQANMVEISVIIPAYNAQEYVLATLNSLVAQDYPAWEAIVVNDGSTDQTLQILERLEDERITIVSTAHRGVSAARNYGLSLAKGSYVYFLDADDLLAVDALSRCRSILEWHPNFVAVYGEAFAFSDESEIAEHNGVAPLFSDRPVGNVMKAILRANFIACGSVVMARKDIIDKTQGFPRELKLGEDWALWVELAGLGDFYHLANPPLVFYRQHTKSASGRLVVDEFPMRAAMDHVYSLPAVTARFSHSELQSYRHSCEVSALLYSAQEFLKQCRWRDARGLYWEAVKQKPQELRAWILMACASMHYVPQFIRARLK
jgi:glycosyltransferase involved in cell wall biosynthesis